MIRQKAINHDNLFLLMAVEEQPVVMGKTGSKQTTKRRSGCFSHPNRDGVTAYSHVAAFLGGLLFTALLILIQDSEKFQNIVFAAFLFGVASSKFSQKDFERVSNIAVQPFTVGFFMFFVSMSVILLIIDTFTGIVGTALSVTLIVWWLRRTSNVSRQP